MSADLLPAVWSIRTFQPKDAPACRKLYLDGLIGGKIADNDTGLDIDDIESVYMQVPGNCFWVAVSADDRVVGMIGVQHHDEGIGEIRRLRVHDQFRRKGIGSGLLEAALRFCQEHQYIKIALDTFIDREPAIRLFEKFHFRHYRTRTVNDKELLYFFLDIYTGDSRGPQTDQDAAQ